MERKRYDELFNEYKPIQHREELWEFINLPEIKIAKNILEVGMAYGGCAAIWTYLCYENGGHFFGIDMDLDQSAYNFNKFKWGNYSLVCGDSKDDRVLKDFESLMLKSSVKELDIAFLDANHDVNHVTKDILNYSQYVKNNGVIAIHDAGDINGEPIKAVNKMIKDGNINQGNLIHYATPTMRGIYYFINN